MSNMKICCRCNENKELTSFHKSKTSKDGLRSYCGKCKSKENTEYNSNNPDKMIALRKKWTKNNPEKVKQLHAKARDKWVKNNPDKNKQVYSKANSKWKKNNPGKWNAIAARYRAAKLNATPKWLTEQNWKEIEEFYVLAHDLAWLNNGEVLSVDHIAPLQGKNSSGLHVPWNLQLLPKQQNSSKGNR